MHVVNAVRSSEYFDSIVDDREDSAVNVIHGAWLEHSSPLGRSDQLEPASPLDLLVLYRAAAETFRDWSTETPRHEVLSPGGWVINRGQAELELRSIPDPQLAALATRFANRVIALSESTETTQDLVYFVELFVRAVRDKRVIDGILSGSISRHSKVVADPDLW